MTVLLQCICPLDPTRGRGSRSFQAGRTGLGFDQYLCGLVAHGCLCSIVLQPHSARVPIFKGAEIVLASFAPV